MATTTFAGNLTADPTTGMLPDGTPIAEFRVIENRRRPDETGQWVDAEPTVHDVRVFGSAAAHVEQSLTKGVHAVVHGTSKTMAWVDSASGQKRTRVVVDVTNRFGEVGPSLRWTSVEIADTAKTSTVG